MNKKNKKENKTSGISLTQVLAVLLSVSLIIILALYSMGKASAMIFWAALLATAIVAYFIIPPMSKMEKRRN